MKQVTATVISKGERIIGLNRLHGRSIRFSQTIRLNCPEIEKPEPGQFVMVRCGDECVLPRPFSIHQVTNREDLTLYFAALENGKGTDWLSQRKVGDKVELIGPMGKGFSIYPTSHNLLLIAGGMGIAPLCFLAQQALNQGCSIRLLLGASTATQLYPRHLLPSEAELVITTEDGTAGKKGMITDLLPDFVDWADQIFACGPMPMYRDMYDQREKLLKGKPVQVSLEVRMGCGRGVCYGCTVKTKAGLKQVCQDGPVFDLDDILWDELSY